MDKGYESKKALGLPIYIDNFADGKPRLCYPCKLKDISDFQLLISLIDTKELKNNLEETQMFALGSILSMCFKLQGEELSSLLLQITEEQYPELMSTILEFNDIVISDSKPIGDEPDIQDNWDVNVCAILTYSSLNVSDVLELTIHQFKRLLSQINKNINYMTKVMTLQNAKEPESYIQEDDYPLYVKQKVEHKGYTSLADIKKMFGGV